MVSVTLSANAGVSIELGGKKVWVDALHDATSCTEFSSVSANMLGQIWVDDRFSPPDVIFVTHCHPDHYKKELVEQAKLRFPEATLVLPQPEFPDQLLIVGDTMERSICGVDFRFFSLPHEQVPYEAVPHYGAVISCNGFSVLVTGDCEVASSALAAQLESTPVDLALVDFPWVALKKGREFIQRYISPRHLLAYHLPFQEDDRWGYREAVQRSAKLLEVPDVRILADRFQTERFQNNAQKGVFI